MRPPLLPAASVSDISDVEKTLQVYGMARENYEWVMREGRPFPAYAYENMRKSHAAVVDAVRLAFADLRTADVDAALSGVLQKWDENRTLDEGGMRLALRSLLESIDTAKR